jgi:hypothetical protein
MQRERIIDALHMAPGSAAGYGMRSSMSRRGNWRGNAFSASLGGSLKVGRLHGQRLFRIRRDAINEIVDGLMFHSHRRLHSSLGYRSPMQIERSVCRPEQAGCVTVCAVGSGSRGRDHCPSTPRRSYSRSRRHSALPLADSLP